MRNLQKKTFVQRERRKSRVRSIITGTAERPRLAVFRSNKNVELQLIDDTVGKTLVRVASKDLGDKGTKVDEAKAAGEALAKAALEAGVKKAVFDRRHYLYHGRVKAVAEGVRAGGLQL